MVAWMGYLLSLLLLSLVSSVTNHTGEEGLVVSNQTLEIKAWLLGVRREFLYLLPYIFSEKSRAPKGNKPKLSLPLGSVYLLSLTPSRISWPMTATLTHRFLTGDDYLRYL